MASSLTISNVDAGYGAVRVLVANLGDAPAVSPVRGPVLVASTGVELPALPPWSAVIVATES